VEYLKNILIYGVIVVTAGCGSQVSRYTNKNNGKNLIGEKVQGLVKDTDGKDFLLTKEITKPRVIIFADYGCLACRSEHKSINALVAKLGHMPQNVDLMTIMVGSIDAQDSLDFASELKLAWTPYWQRGDKLFKNLCPQGQTPCTVIEKPSFGIVSASSAEKSLDEIQQITGVWQ
jgi:hypothetical protein